MPFRFRRRITILPGVHLNVGMRGVGLSVGVPGASVSIGRTGTYVNVGLPGTGLSYRQRIGGAAGQIPGNRDLMGGGGVPNFSTVPRRAATQPPPERLPNNNETNAPATHTLARAAAQDQFRAAAAQQAEREADARTDWLIELESIHTLTPSPAQRSQFIATPFAVPAPTRPAPLRYEGLRRLSGAHRREVDARNAAQDAEYAAAHASWVAAERAHKEAVARAGALFAARDTGDAQRVADFFEWYLPNLVWPRQTEVQFEISDDGRTAKFDIDLPEIEDLPRSSDGQNAALTESHQRRLYARHVHGVCLRVAGEAFANAPGVQAVTVSGYSQRRAAQSEERVQEYLLSAKITRPRWELIDFEHFAHIDPSLLFERFETRRDVTPTGDLRRIDPF